MAVITITGGAGFIGFHLQKHLERDHRVQAIDRMDPGNVAVSMRGAQLGALHEADIHSAFLTALPEQTDMVIHLAAETGIPGSLHHPQKYFETNVRGTFNVLEQCRKNGVKYLIYASSSSVYEPSAEMKETSGVSRQLSYYGTTKRMCEVMTENYCAQFGLTAIGLRFFTVYGSWTRPDMAAYRFMKAIDEGREVTVYPGAARDFTHVHDVVESIRLLAGRIVSEPPGFHGLFNIGFGSPVDVAGYASLIAKGLGRELKYRHEPIPSNELLTTHSNSDKLAEYIGFRPRVDVRQGIVEMTEWFGKVRYE